MKEIDLSALDDLEGRLLISPVGALDLISVCFGICSRRIGRIKFSSTEPEGDFDHSTFAFKGIMSLGIPEFFFSFSW